MRAEWEPKVVRPIISSVEALLYKGILARNAFRTPSFDRTPNPRTGCLEYFLLPPLLESRGVPLSNADEAHTTRTLRRLGSCGALGRIPSHRPRVCELS